MRGRSNAIAWALALEAAPAALFAAAVTYCTALLVAAPITSPAPAIAAIAAFAAGWAALHLFGGGPQPFPFPSFDASLFDPEEVDVPQEEPELLLDEPVRRPSDVDRVVSLFAVTATPTPGELHQRIERHLRNTPRAALPDATEALHEALAELRRSLR